MKEYKEKFLAKFGSFNSEKQYTFASIPSFNHVRGTNFDALNGLYIDSSKDKYDNNKSGIKNDKTKSYSKVKRNNWYEQKVADYTFDAKTEKGKNDFLNQNKTIIVNYVLSVNLWNSAKKWTYDGGKYPSLEPKTELTSYLWLTGTNHIDWDEKQYTDPSHSSNETVQIGFEEEWKDSVLTISIVYRAKVHWKSGSVINHAALIRSTNTEYSFIETKKKLKPKVKTGVIPAFVTRGVGEYEIPLESLRAELDNSIKNNLIDGIIVPVSTLLVLDGKGQTGGAFGNLLMLNYSQFMRDVTKEVLGTGRLGALDFLITPGFVNYVYIDTDGDAYKMTPMETERIDKEMFTWTGVWTIVYLVVEN